MIMEGNFGKVKVNGEIWHLKIPVQKVRAN